MELLTRQSDQNLTRLSHRLETERNAIRERLEVVNESLRGAEFNPGTFLTIESGDRLLDAVKAFRAELKAAHSGSLSSDVRIAEQRFLALKSLAGRLASQDTGDQRWRALVLDVRQHIDFIARERDAAGVEVEVYRSGAGKSGGQRQKLAATCLAAALRYQLGGVDGAFPTYSTVVLDEAFDKADPKFTALAMNIFVTFGFQMVVATPLRSVMALEPFIGGATYVSIGDRRHSRARHIDYDEAQSRLRLDEAQEAGGRRAVAAGRRCRRLTPMLSPEEARQLLARRHAQQHRRWLVEDGGVGIGSAACRLAAGTAGRPPGRAGLHRRSGRRAPLGGGVGGCAGRLAGGRARRLGRAQLAALRPAAPAASASSSTAPPRWPPWSAKAGAGRGRASAPPDWSPPGRSWPAGRCWAGCTTRWPTIRRPTMSGSPACCAGCGRIRHRGCTCGSCRCRGSTPSGSPPARRW